jgi:hypothetical protein
LVGFIYFRVAFFLPVQQATHVDWTFKKKNNRNQLLYPLMMKQPERDSINNETQTLFCLYQLLVVILWHEFCCIYLRLAIAALGSFFCSEKQHLSQL